MSPVLAGTEAWFYIVTTFGAVTMLVGGYLALTKTDLKRVLAYSTVSALGTLVLLLGLASPAAATAAIVFLLAHALYKGAFFMLAGAVDHETGTRNILTLGGLRRVMPLTAAIALLAAVSLAGFGPVFSFIAKELLLEAVLEVERARFILLPAVVLAGALFVAVAAIVGIRPFFGALKATPKRVHEAPPSLWLGPALLSLSGVVIGVFPVLVTATVVAPAVISVAGETTPVSLYLWHGFNLALVLSAVSVLVGLVLYYSWTALRRVTSKLEGLLLWGPEASYERFMAGLVWLARLQTQMLQGGLLRHYLMSIFTAMTLLVGGTLLFKGGLAGTFDVAGNVASVFPYEWVLASLILLGALMTILTSSRLAAIIALGVVGFSVALTFIVYGAPDVAMTQLFVETLTVILVSLVLIHLKTFSSVATLPARLRDAAIAVAAGATVTALMLAVLTTPFNFSLSEYFAEQSLPVAHGRNIVNVILVDFRALDTLGEITVLVIAGAGIFALLKLRAGNRRSKA
jgi:multicomponent Na+:H+ antiporter subunit A